MKIRFLDGSEKKETVDLQGANLREADLYGANLYGANLQGANLQGANLREADLYGANLQGANLRGANLRGADLRGADLRGADLRGADLCGANLQGANLKGADLCGANLQGADLQGAELDVKVNYLTVGYFSVIPEGKVIAWKRIRNNIVKLEIPEDAKRSSATTRKCRVSKAKVLSISDGLEEIRHISYGHETIYRVGDMVYPDYFDTDRWVECSNGIHCFMTEEEAIEYQELSKP